MRPEGRGELDSLYFEYPVFCAPSNRDHLGDSTRVAIVGAGPIGMTAALALAQHGIQCVLFEAKRTFNDGSRAICIARQSMQIFQMLGAVQSFCTKALPYTAGRTYFRGQQILRFDMEDSDDEKYRPMYNLQQQYIETFLHRAVAQCDLIDVRWGSRVEALADVPDGVCLSVTDNVGDYELVANWVLAADGARSALRGMRGKRLQGENYEGRYVIADVRMAFDHPIERLCLFDPTCRPGGTVLVHGQPDSIWRIDYQLGADETEYEALREDAIRVNVESVLADIDYHGTWELEWWSIYSANTLALEDYRDGRVFFIGDSAHIVPIFGVRGLNNGIADAQNLGWKLASVIDGKADEKLLDSYSPERRGATLDVFNEAAKSTRFMTPPTRGWTLMRDAALLLALRHPFAGDFANPRNMTPYTYSHGPLTGFDEGNFLRGPQPGAVAINVRQENGFLLDRFGESFTALVFGELEQEFELVPCDDIRVVKEPVDGPVAYAYDATPGTAYLFRPDLHLGGRWRNANGRQIIKYVSWLLSGGRYAK